MICQQTDYNKKIIGKGADFYATARAGPYRFAEHYVVFRDNTTWAAAVISSVETEWEELKRPLFQKHAVSICEDSDGNYITLDEAHYICAILNTECVKNYIMSSSDSRSYPIRLKVAIPKYNPDCMNHVKMSNLSKKAHASYNNEIKLTELRQQMESTYYQLISQP